VHRIKSFNFMLLVRCIVLINMILVFFFFKNLSKKKLFYITLTKHVNVLWTLIIKTLYNFNKFYMVWSRKKNNFIDKHVKLQQQIFVMRIADSLPTMQ
jgi:hypothetical protein